MAGKNKGEIAETLVIPYAIKKSKDKVILADKYEFKKKNEETFTFRDKEFKISDLEEHCDKIITSTKSGTKGGVVKNPKEYEKTLEFLGIKNDESLKAPSLQLYDIEIDGKKGHIKSYTGKDPALLGYSPKTMISHEIESEKSIKQGETFKKIIKDGAIVKSSKIKNEKVEKTLEKINKDLPDLYIKMDKELAQTTSSEFYNGLNESEKRAALDFCKASFNGFAPKTCEDYTPNNEEHFIIEVDKDGSIDSFDATDTYFENLFLDDRIRLDAPSKSKVNGCRTIDKKDNKLFYNEAPYFRTKRPKKDNKNK